ncbi:MAG: hypothetical protein ABR543_11870 [Gemmatimonadaceae bacterium]
MAIGRVPWPRTYRAMSSTRFTSAVGQISMTARCSWRPRRNTTRSSRPIRTFAINRISAGAKLRIVVVHAHRTSLTVLAPLAPQILEVLNTMAPGELPVVGV